ncbi:carbohydrate ABC transporter permease [Anaerosacchariphilus sp. NSJ-68]|uniref:Carbohydrate ABC transporter permease n=2 Tax=Lachnospiraceae TaxID=186803 RepID=A0A923RMM6_9FIRM|nr:MULTISPECIES: carbohydrate ABC transporter permease [Lachnospiraceae]MBC5660458.1 carbohydrate ABC transporter permease [Anaerosacchariphilus hominis]MBC5697694.1 carbohydrate ABC transporter permease [Roseburia difficilis]
MYKKKQKIAGFIGVIAKILICLIFLFPFLWMISISLQTATESSRAPITFIPASPQWQNFVTAWNMAPFGLYLKNSIIIIFSIVILQSLVMVPAAYAFAKFKFKGRGFLFGLVLVAFMMPVQVTFLPVYYMMGDWRLVNTLIPQILPHMTNAFGIFLLRQYFMQVPDELLEAARLDNASELKILGKIMLPMSKPAISAIALLSFVGHWNDYFWPLMMTRADAVRPLTVGIAALKDAEGNNNWNVIMAGNMFLVMPLVLIYIFASKFIINSFTYSGIK